MYIPKGAGGEVLSNRTKSIKRACKLANASFQFIYILSPTDKIVFVNFTYIKPGSSCCLRTLARSYYHINLKSDGTSGEGSTFWGPDCLHCADHLWLARSKF